GEPKVTVQASSGAGVSPAIQGVSPSVMLPGRMSEGETPSTAGETPAPLPEPLQPKLLTLEIFRGTPLEQALNERVALGTNDNAISTLIKLEDLSRVGMLRQALPGMIVLDQRDFVEHIAKL